MAEVLEMLVDAGKVTAGPPLGPTLGPLGVNIGEVISFINEKTKHFEGMKVPIKLTVDTKTKSYELEVGTPPTSALIMKELGIEKGSGDALRKKVGNLEIEQVMKISDMKKDSMLGKTKKDRMMEVAGACVSMGVTIEGKTAKETQEELRSGRYDGIIPPD
ncbi:MAG: 50S ribosomal protein L11 [Methanomassiliicoccales archaeon]|nr:MAG: 50S ribosomal protein L11 [Methanomassiliicoccales archaeon]